MTTIVPRIAIGAGLLWSFQAALLLAQPALPTGWQGMKMYELDRATDALTAKGFAAPHKAEAFMAWMKSNEWRSLEANDLYNLYTWISVDSVDPRHFSARWTGTLTPPATGTYTIKQLRSYSGNDSRLKVLVDGQVVLDSMGKSTDDSQYASRPMQLTAGEAVAIQVELIHDMKTPPPVYDFSADAPMVALTWSRNGADENLIPATAFAPPPGFAKAGANGLKGEYFGNTQFGDLKSIRLDPALDLIWSWPPVAPIHQIEASEVLNACKAKFLDGAYLSRCAAEGRERIFGYTMWRVAYQMRASERQQLVEVLIDKPDVLAAMTPEAMGRLMQAIHMLPAKAHVGLKKHIELLGEWAATRPQPRARPGQFPGWGKGFYQELNTDYYWLMGHFLRGPYWSDVESLWGEYLVRSNGECNLAIAYLTAYATREESFTRGGRYRHVFYDRLQEVLDDDSVTGDERMTWLLAWAMADEVMHADHPRPLAGRERREEARLTAESSDYQFWALQEVAARYASLGQVDRLDQLLGQRTGETPGQVAAITEWRRKAASLTNVYAEQREQQAIKSKEAFVEELERRLTVAQQRQNQAEINRYERLIHAAKPTRDQ